MKADLEHAAAAVKPYDAAAAEKEGAPLPDEPIHGSALAYEMNALGEASASI